MGYNTTVVVMNDALSGIETDPDFGKKLASATRRVALGIPVDVTAGGFCNAATVLETHHSAYCTVMLIGGNFGLQLPGVTSNWDSKTPEMDLLTKLAEKLGYSLRKKKVR